MISPRTGGKQPTYQSENGPTKDIKVLCGPVFFMGETIMDPVNHQCGQKIRLLREGQQLLQRELAEKAGLPERTIGRIERGEVDVRLGTLKKIADALGNHIRDFFQ